MQFQLEFKACCFVTEESEVLPRLEGARILAGALGYRPRQNIFPRAPPPPPQGAKIKTRAPLWAFLRMLLKIKQKFILQ